MNSAAPNYQLPTFTGVLNHSWLETLFVRDEAREIQYELDAKVLSGDYFVTLATEIDSINGDIVQYATREKLEEIVSDLIYLQDHYKITKKELE